LLRKIRLAPPLRRHAFDHRGHVQRIGINDRPERAGQRCASALRRWRYRRCVNSNAALWPCRSTVLRSSACDGLCYRKCCASRQSQPRVASSASCMAARTTGLPIPKIVVPAQTGCFIPARQLRSRRRAGKLPVRRSMSIKVRSDLPRAAGPIATSSCFGYSPCALLLRRGRDQQRQPDHSPPYSCLGGMNTVGTIQINALMHPIVAGPCRKAPRSATDQMMRNRKKKPLCAALAAPQRE